MDECAKNEISGLIKKVALGDENALILLYEKTAARLLSIATALTHNRSDAEDAVSETFIRVVKYAKSFYVNDNGYGWIATIARNCATDILKKRRPDVNVDDLFSLSSDSDFNDDKADIQAALNALDKEEQKLIYLYYYNDKTVRDIADMLNIPKSTVQYRITRVENKLKELLRPPED